MIPIPKSMLTQTVKVGLPVKGGYGGETQDPIDMEHVRFEEAATISRTDYQLQAPVRGTLFIDAHNSNPAIELPAGTMVLLEGEESECCVHECLTLRDGHGRIHHWEVILV